jgi:alkylhydroperoxidase family enzyme
VGVTDEQIRALSFYERSAAFDEVEKAVILHADRLTRGAVAVRDGTLQDLRRHFSEDQIVELTLVVCAGQLHQPGERRLTGRARVTSEPG